MLADDVLRCKPVVLSQDQREFYFENGYLHLDGFISDDWMDRLWQVTDRFVNDSRDVGQSDSTFDLEPNHSSDAPRLRRLNQPAEQDPVYREFALNGPIVDLAQDLLGPDVKYHHSKLNFKWASGGEEVKWHQDIQFWPHTNYSPLTIGVYMNDVTDEMGPMGIIPGSHKGELFDLFDDDLNWAGAIKERELDRVDLDKVVWLKGKRGSVTVHNCRMVHGSEPNRSTETRPLLLHTYAAADAVPICASIADGWPLANTIVRGKPARWMRFDERPCLIPPDWSAGYSSIFALQQQEAAE
jgi:ectoine hydroxylase